VFHPFKTLLKVNLMVKSLVAVASIVLLGMTQTAFAAGDYNDVPSSDPQYKQCLAYSSKNYEGGNAPSPIAGQTKMAAFCECMWNETPDDFKGNLAKFSESPKGKKINQTCEKYANWGD
jgi:hypothetical protein